MAQSHVTSGIANKINLLNKHKQALLKQIQDIDQQISILTQAAYIMGEAEQLPRLRSSVFNQSIKTLVVQVLKQATQPLSANEITEQAVSLDNQPQSNQEPIEITAKPLKATRNALNFLISDGVVSKIGLKRGEVKYLWASNQQNLE
ncbi:hypothetical protein [Neisseria animalis]|uniref:Uncharacterized protein n=1 Tax=Neisseria animalis TaxID=492 RepID=A0A5P3MT26_NEIAN|nr:hypothetical protein [Neisseria animalis]QEY24610.1 hypothetical protein D0T90_09145 [Neisseria animalis]ROW32978.1 hypothetical protein CGZ60_01580 [Neisseria animalis]VEE07475.1 Uncharacterised protein [Neisseria animalis]